MVSKCLFDINRQVHKILLVSLLPLSSLSLSLTSPILLPNGRRSQDCPSPFPFLLFLTLVSLFILTHTQDFNFHPHTGDSCIYLTISVLLDEVQFCWCRQLPTQQIFLDIPKGSQSLIPMIGTMSFSICPTHPLVAVSTIKYSPELLALTHLGPCPMKPGNTILHT